MPIFEGKLQVFSVIWVKWKQSVSSITLLYSGTSYSLFLPFFVVEIFKFKDDKFFVRRSASIFKFKWFEQPCMMQRWHDCGLENIQTGAWTFVGGQMEWARPIIENIHMGGWRYVFLKKTLEIFRFVARVLWPTHSD